MTEFSKVLLIIPCFNEENRLDERQFFENSNFQLNFLFANDYSTDGTLKKLQNMQKKDDRIQIFSAPKNVGKGEVIRLAYLDFLSKNKDLNYDWIGFWDADLATPLYEVKNMIRYVEFYGTPVSAVWGSRLYRLGSRIVRSPVRHYLGRGFATVIALLLKVDSYDSQCGAKLFNKEAAEVAFREPFISRWIFDVEILLRLQQKGVIEYPLREWCDIPGSKMKIGREILRVFKDILKIRDQYILKK